MGQMCDYLFAIYTISITLSLYRILEKLVDLQANLQKALTAVFYDNTIIEWVQVVLTPKIKKMSEVAETGQRLLSQNNALQMMS